MIYSNTLRLAISAAGLLLLGLGVKAQTNTPNDKKIIRQEKKAEKREKINALIKQEEEGAIIYQKQNTFGIRLYSDGWGAYYEKGFQKSVNKTNLFSLEIGERKHPKEDKEFNLQSNGWAVFGTPLIYGKQNNFFFAKLGVGQSYLIGGKGNRNGVAVSAVYKGGLSLGGLKPYYVDVQNPDNLSETIAIKWENGEGENDDLFLGAPISSSGVFKGFGEIKLKPGAFFQGALRFDYGRYNEVISALTAGFNVEYYTTTMPIMIERIEANKIIEPKKLFLNVFISLEFGRRK